MPYHAIALLSGARQKTLPNKTESDMLSQVVLPFAVNGIVTARWGNKQQSYQVLELSIYQTKDSWDKKKGPLADLIRNKRNLAVKFLDQAKKLLAKDKPRVFVITPIQGDKNGDQEQQRILKEFDSWFETIEKLIERYGGISIRIDRERPMEDLVTSIKKELRVCQFVIADLTDERQSCYFEAGFAEALNKPVIYMASENSILSPGNKTKIHFDIHMNVQFFKSILEMRDKVASVIEKNKVRLFPEEQEIQLAT